MRAHLLTSIAACVSEEVHWIRHQLLILGFLLLSTRYPVLAAPQGANYVADVDRQPLEAAVSRVVQAMQIAGSPLPEEDLKALSNLKQNANDPQVVRRLQEILDPHCLAKITINPESRVKVSREQASAQLDQRGWTNFLVKVVNEAGVTGPLSCLSDQAQPMFVRSDSSPKPNLKITPADAKRRWLDIRMLNSQPMLPKLSGLRVEYRILQLYSRDRGAREATLSMHVGQGTQDLGFRSDLPILFQCRPSVEIPLEVLDWDGTPTTCSLLIKDQYGRVYPNPSRRLAPDFFFHEQIYRADGESVRLAPGDYSIQVFRGPEYHVQKMDVTVDEQSAQHPLRIQLRRWIHMTKHGWFSGDHHVHAAGCSHYQNPTEGVTPKDMMRHLLGEDLNVGCVLSWGPCWYYQKEFFNGAVSELSRPGNLMRYDVEVSGFPSSHAGHLCLLNLTEDDYPGTKSIEQWPSWTLPVLDWGKEQGGVVGYSHSGWGLALPDIMPNGTRGRLPKTWGGADPSRQGRAADQLPDYAMPPFDGIGANEFIVATTQGVCDFISAVDTPVIWELNIWYHTLNCGFTTRISGETDFPCIYGERVGLGRSYVQVPGTSAEDLEYRDWVEGLRDGRSYVSDGMSHLLNFSIGDFQLGQNNTSDSGRASLLELPEAGKQTIRSTVAALLPKKQAESGQRIANRRLDEKPYWHLERSRIGKSRRVPVELVVNGHAVARKEIEADGNPKELSFEYDFEQSSWVALRVLPSMHTNPIFVEIAGQPIHASRRSAEWCRDAVDVCWNQKRKQIRQEEIGAAKAAYDKARRIYEEIIQQSSPE
ncbi:MAG: CehA/McbA family metallohydrolase [Aureliella sp.]